MASPRTTAAKTTPLKRHRRRLKRRGILRVEVCVAAEDADLVRGVAGALADPERAGAARALLRAQFAPPAGLKALLAAAPLDGIDLERSRDTGRDVAL